MCFALSFVILYSTPSTKSHSLNETRHLQLPLLHSASMTARLIGYKSSWARDRGLIVKFEGDTEGK
eukprot:2992912-Amphidinium_carterae.1